MYLLGQQAQSSRPLQGRQPPTVLPGTVVVCKGEGRVHLALTVQAPKRTQQHHKQHWQRPAPAAISAASHMTLTCCRCCLQRCSGRELCKALCRSALPAMRCRQPPRPQSRSRGICPQVQSHPLCACGLSLRPHCSATGAVQLAQAARLQQQQGLRHQRTPLQLLLLHPGLLQARSWVAGGVGAPRRIHMPRCWVKRTLARLLRERQAGLHDKLVHRTTG